MLAGLILAAGSGSRFGSESKLLAQLDGRPLLEHAVRAHCGVAGLERIAVVLGSRAQEILESVDWGRAEPVIFERWSEGQAASLRAGVEYLFGALGASKAIVTLGDEPLITSTVIARFLDEPPSTSAVYHGRPGHPVVLGREQAAALSQLTGDRGARRLLEGARTIECSGLCSGRDVDTPQDLEAIRDEARAVL